MEIIYSHLRREKFQTRFKGKFLPANPVTVIDVITKMRHILKGIVLLGFIEILLMEKMIFNATL